MRDDDIDAVVRRMHRRITQIQLALVATMLTNVAIIVLRVVS